jgi:hypothetical protein
LKQSINDTIAVTHSMGGMIHFTDKGIYRNTLKISSEKYKKTWRIQLKDDIQSGSLKINRKIVYHYILDEKGFRLQEVENDVAVSDWVPIDYNIIMID